MRHCSNVSPASRLPPGNSQRPPRCESAWRRVMSSLPSWKMRAELTSMGRLAALFFKVTTARRACKYAYLPKQSLSSDALVNPAEFFHFGGIKEVAAVEHNWVRERFFRPIQVESFELFPFGRNDNGIATFSDGVHVVHVDDIRAGEQRFGLFHGLGIVHAQGGAFLEQTLAQVNRRRGAHVVGVLLEGQSENADFFI